MSGENERLLPEPENYAKCFYDLFKNVAEAQRYESPNARRITSFAICLLDAINYDFDR